MGETTPNISIYIPSSGEDLYRPSFKTGQQNLDSHNHEGAPTGGVKLGEAAFLDGAITPEKLSAQVRHEYDYISNIGISYSAGTFSVVSSNGSALTASNRAFVTFQDKSSPGLLVTITAQDNASFQDASGTSDIAGNLFGFPDAFDISEDVTFFLYAVSNDDEDALEFALSIQPCLDVSPDTSEMGSPISPTADTANSMWFLNDVVFGDFDGNPVRRVACFRMKKVGGAANDWQVQALTNSDGVGKCECGEDGEPGDDACDCTGAIFSNLGMAYNSGTGTFTIVDSEGEDLTPVNKGVVWLPSKTVPGTMVKYEITENQDFIDDNGASQIIGNTFGTTTLIAWAQDVPFYVYAVGNDTEDDLKFMICRYPHITTSPPEASIGAPDDPVANTEASFWSFENLNETVYDNNPCTCIGSFRMRKSALDDWTVQTLGNTDGFDQYQENVLFLYPINQNGSVSNSHFFPNSGTTPAFTTQTYDYQVTKSGSLWILIIYDNCSTPGANGGGDNQLRFTLPLKLKTTSRSMSVNMMWMNANSATPNARSMLIADGGDVADKIFMWENGASVRVTNALFEAGDRLDAMGWLKIGIS